MATSTLQPSRRRRPSTGYRRTDQTASPLLRRGALGALLLGTACLYVCGLSASGYANSFYSAAVQAGSQSWKAFFFGSLDAANAITVDKPPASLWLMAISVRIFGLSSWSILVPQALLGVATVAVSYASVRRTAGHWAGLLAGALLALTPAATLMFRFNNPDALLVFLLTLATYFALRATERASGKWLVGAGILVGFGFLTKMLQAFLVLPALALVYLIAAPTSVKKRLLHLLQAFAAMIVTLGWWVAIVELVPASWRPYIGGSRTDSVLELIFGYNGVGRITGNETGSTGGGGNRGGQWGSPGLTRLFDGVSGGMIGWLIPAALLLTVFALLALRRMPRTNLTRAAIIAWAGSLVVTGLVLSLMAGIYYDYYTVALAPAIAATVALGTQVLWRIRTGWLGRIGLALPMAITTAWAAVLVNRAGDPYASLTWVIAGAGTLATIGLLLLPLLPKAAAAVVVGLAVVGGVSGPAAYSFNTAATPHEGSIVTAGPVTGMGAGGRSPGGNRPGQRLGNRNGGQFPRAGTSQAVPRQGPGAHSPVGGPVQNGSGPGAVAAGGPLTGIRVSAETARLLTYNASSYTWVAATTGAQGAASYQLATRFPVLAIGGFNGSDPSPTLDQFKSLVAKGEIHYYIGGGQGGGRPNNATSDSAQIAAWVTQNYPAKTVDGTTIYDLTHSHGSR